MRVLASTLGLAVLLLAPAEARELAIASVTPQVACVFAKTCAVTPTDSYGFIKLFGDGGVGRLLTRTYPGLPGTPAAGLTGYSFQVDMGMATALGTPNCIEKLVIDTGPLASLPYGSKGSSAQLFVVAAQGSAGVSSASQSGSKLTVSFAKPICPMTHGSRSTPNTDSLYFGFAAKGDPAPAKGQVVADMDGTAVDVRVPRH